MENNNFCQNCGNKVDINAKFCANCGNAINMNFNSSSPNIGQYNSNSLTCPNCGSHNIQVQIVSENKNVGCGTILLCIIFAWTIIGLIILISLLLNNKVNRKYYVCQNCGKTFGKTPDSSDDNTIGNTIAGIIVILGSIFLFVYLLCHI